MIQAPYRVLKRLFVFIPGIIIAYVSYRYTLPYFHRRVPLVIAILLTYALAAYVLIPGLIRIFRIVIPPKHVPLYCITPDGFASDPLNVGLIGNRQQIIDAMTKAGWYLADGYTLPAVLRHIFSIVTGVKYLNAPVSGLYLFGRKQDLAFEMLIDGNNTRRHHVRFWATTFEKDTDLSADAIYWHHQKTPNSDKQLLWIGAASMDIGIMPIRHNLQITHKVHPDTNQERELIVNQLKAGNTVGKVQHIKLGNPYKLVNRTWRGELQTDGNMAVIRFK